ncbi:ComEA family DNA-binding protein [Maribacter algicola]|uniref:ComEA family DNA-binding protein n=1 Tax=Meishania litoralis TaxID=3434685 RepID=A0ACC7LM25_9FLAO
MKKLKSRFASFSRSGKFTKQERSGIFFLLLIIILLQIGYFTFKTVGFRNSSESFAVDTKMQSQIDALRESALKKDTFKIFPFNPNFITDHKGYAIGMSVEQIDRLHAFRKQGRFANSAEEFQKVTKVSDSLLQKISPYFKFPDWTQNRNSSEVTNKVHSYDVKKTISDAVPGSGYKDLNEATADDLKSIKGIGEKLSARIIKFRNRLGGFLVDEQLYDVYGLEPDVVESALKKFKVLNPPKIDKININSASANDIGKLAYLQKNVAQGIVDYRNHNGTINSFEELSKIEDFPTEKIDRIRLYLSL